MLKNVYVGYGVRTPFGALSGSLAEMTAAQLGSTSAKTTIDRAGIDPAQIDEVVFGNVIQAGHGQNVARQVSLGAGVPKDVGCTTVNKVCGSAMRAVVDAARAIMVGDAGLVLAGGTESMTNAPFLLKKARSGYRMGNGELIDGMINDGLWDVYNGRHMGSFGDQCATKYDISREEQDQFSIESFEWGIQAWEEGFFKPAVTPVEVKTRKETIIVDRDEGLAKYRGPEKLRSLRPAFSSEGTVTAGNASTINDGAASLLVFDDAKKDALGLKPSGRILGYANAAMEPEWFSIAPIYAIRNLCEKLSINVQDVDLFEINEAFAVVSLAAIKELNLDRARVNVAGGAVAIGHPIGATGTRLINTLLRAMEVRDKKLGIACLCIGGGEAMAMAFERA